MTFQTITDTEYPGVLWYQDKIVFMYSPAPVIYRASTAPDGTPFTLVVRSNETQRSYAEARSTYGGSVRFDISRILQHLMPVDATACLPGVDFDAPSGASEFTVELQESNSEETLAEWSICAVHGALDQLETYRENSNEQNPSEQRRLWVNFPQTFRLWRDYAGDFLFQDPAGTKCYLSLAAQRVAYEVDLMRTRSERDAGSLDAMRAALRAGNPQTLGLSTYVFVEVDSNRYRRDIYYLRLLPDLTPRDSDTTYLRWLHRDGSVGYWLFNNGTLTNAVTASSSFSHFIEGDPHEPSGYDQHYIIDSNPVRGDFSESRILTLGTDVRTSAEYDYLIGLATSPVVDRYVQTDNGEWAWQRVNIVADSYARSRKTRTPKNSAFEISIQLPPRNTIKL
jgi:hypothetical protein